MKLTSSFAFAFLAPVASASVLVVDPTNGPYAEVQAAVDAARDGDVLLVKTGTYASFVVRNKDLSIVADTSANVVIDGAIRVGGLAATRTLLLAGLNATGKSSSNPTSIHGLYARNCDGSLRVQDCPFGGATTEGPCGLRADGVRIEACDDVVLTRCLVRGPYDYVDWLGNGDGSSPMGLLAVDSVLSLYDCDVRGGPGEAGARYDCEYGYGDGDGGNGGRGLWCVNTTLVASGSLFLGGNGGNAVQTPCMCFCTEGGDGGVGARIQSSPPGLALDCQFLGGIGGAQGVGGFSACTSWHGWPGGTLWSDPASAPAQPAGSRKQLVAPTIARESTTIAMTYQGSPGDVVRLWTSESSRSRFVPAMRGMRVPEVEHPDRALQVGVVPPGGLVTTWTIPDPGPSGARRVFVQPYFVGANRTTLGTPQAIVLLDSAY